MKENNTNQSDEERFLKNHYLIIVIGLVLICAMAVFNHYSVQINANGFKFEPATQLVQK